jgi:NitT/TauT family transport system ATP-binding protein
MSGTAATSALSLAGVWQAFESADGAEVLALSDVSLDVAPGEFVSLVGPSGCGKSTALRLITGLVSPTRGSAAIHGQPVRERLDDVGMVFQKATLLHWLSVEDNVLLPVRVRRGRVTAEDRQRARALLAATGLEQFASKMPHELSGGMQQRAAICRALVQDPDILLMDEPFGALDALTREQMCFDLLRLWTQRRKTIVFVTHSIPEAVLLSDRVVVMSPRPGRIERIVPVDLPRPRTLASMAHPDFQACTQAIRHIIYGHDAERAARSAAL